MDESNSNKFDSDQVDRLWQHRLNVNSNFNNFVNFFLLAESILLAVVGMLADKPMVTKPIILSLIALGIILTLVWMYVQGKQKYILDILKKRCEEFMPEYKISRELRQAKRWRISNGWLLAHFVPTLITAIWIVILSAML